jgi:hypothetical protein
VNSSGLIRDFWGKQTGQGMGIAAEWLGALVTVEAAGPGRGEGVTAVLAGEHGLGDSRSGAGRGRRRPCGQGRVSPELRISEKQHDRTMVLFPENFK